MKLPIYMDHHATTPADPRVIESMMPYFTEHFGNAASHQHSFGWEADAAVEQARKSVARAVSANPKEIVFTSGATESNNLALKGVAEALRAQGNHIITSKTEHRSVLDVCGVLGKSGFRVSYVDADEYGIVHPEAFKDVMTDGTILVSVMMANNEIGTIAPIAEIGKLCLEKGVLFHSDATQALGKVAIDVIAMNVHLLSMSAHKIYGPKGVGALYVRSKNPRVRIVQQQDGGGHEQGMRSGTLNVPSIVGFGRAVEIAMNELHDETVRVAALRERLEARLLSIDGVRRNGHPEYRLCNTLNVTIPFVSADSLISAVRKDVALSSGSACSSAEHETEGVSHVLTAIGLDKERARCTIRIGLGRFTTVEEVEHAGSTIEAAVNSLRASSPLYQMSKRNASHKMTA
jgi:cysteine desulfurase